MLRIIRLAVSFALLQLASIALALKENDQCTNPRGQPGRCIHFRECDPIMQIYNKAVISPDETTFVTRSQCGSTPDKRLLVCCAVSADNPIRSVEKATLPKPPHCGLDFSDRIAGGQRTALDEFPWAALIQYRHPNGETGFYCGATLIHSRYAVTAAHCVRRRGLDSLQVIGVRLGEWDLDSKMDCMDGECADAPVDVNIEEIIVHENFDPGRTKKNNDIALIRFTKDVNMTLFISPVCLPIDANQRFRNNVGTKGWVVGWGKTETGSKSKIKLKAALTFQDHSSCSKLYRQTYMYILQDTQLCAGGIGSQDSCSGDSGGSLTKLDRANHFLYGIVSLGQENCGAESKPGVYTDVAKYIEWIESNLK